MPRWHERWTTVVVTNAIRVVHRSVKSATHGLLESSESLRIVLNSAKIMTHLYSTLQYCVAWPAAMNVMIKVASVFALDLFEPARLPCIVTGYDYYFRVWVAILTPLVFTAAVVIGCIIYARCFRKRRRKRVTVAASKTTARIAQQMAQQRGVHTSVVKDGLWLAVFASRSTMRSGGARRAAPR